MFGWFRGRTMAWGGMVALAGLSLGMMPGRAWGQGAVAKETKESKEAHYKLGNQYFAAKQWGLAADQLFMSDLESPAYGAHARLRLAYAQTQLGLKSYAAYHVNALESAELAGSEARTLQNLKTELAPELKAYKTTFYSVTPYAGRSSFSATSTKQSALIYGASGTFASQGWGLSLGGEGVGVKFRSTAAAKYTQTQLTLGVSKALDERWSLRANLAMINTATTAYKGNVYGFGTTAGLWSGGWLSADFEHSSYPSGYNSAHLGLNQGSVGLFQEIYGDANVRVSGNVLYQAVFVNPTAKKPVTGVVLDSTYHRFAVGADLGVGICSLGVSAWFGHEAFGVRNQGSLVYNALEEHNGGWSVAPGVLVTEGLRLFVGYSHESIDVKGVDASSQTMTGGLTGYF